MINLKDKKVIFSLFLFLLLLFLDFSFILRRQIISLNKINLKIRQLKQEFLLISKGLSESDLKKKLENLKKEFRGNKILFEEEIPDLIDEISKIAKKTNLKINRISPLKDLKAVALLETCWGKFYPLSITIELSSGYHSIGKFLNLLESHEKFLKLEELDISPESSDPFCHRVKLALWTFFVRK